MAFTWYLDKDTNDLVIDDNGGLLRVASGNEVLQRVKVSLLHHWQEYFLNMPGGVPWFQSILGKRDLKLAELIIREAILSVPGVLAITRFKVYFANRELSFDIWITVVGDYEFEVRLTERKILEGIDYWFLENDFIVQLPKYTTPAHLVLTTDPVDSCFAGDVVVLSVEIQDAVFGEDYEIRFEITDPADRDTYIELRDYAVSRTFDWTTTFADAGERDIRAYGRIVGTDTAFGYDQVTFLVWVHYHTLRIYEEGEDAS